VDKWSIPSKLGAITKSSETLNYDITAGNIELQKEARIAPEQQGCSRQVPACFFL
jgi:hypothetical protein